MGAARAGETAAQASLVDARFQQALTTTNQFFDALAAAQLVRVREVSVRRAEEQLKVSVNKLRAGSATRSDSLRSLVYRACEDYLAGTDVTMLASMAKLKAGRLRREVSDACLQYWGGAGYLWDNPVARSYRDGRLGSIGGGADEVMLQIISS
jgi:alkylation response protein AidB-like acyl-CoA dehydrogenase